MRAPIEPTVAIAARRRVGLVRRHAVKRRRHPGRPSPSTAPRTALPGWFPWGREREALDSLSRLKVERCLAVLRRVAEELRLPPGGSLAAAALLLRDLLARIHETANPLPLTGSRRASADELMVRWDRARRLGGAHDLPALRRAFLEEAERMLETLAGGRGLRPGVARARAYLDRNFTRKIALEEVAEAVHLSPNYLSAVFRKETGMTITSYLRERRIRSAKRLLLDGRHTVSEVAYLVGYQSYRDFHRNFARAGRLSPRAFRRANRGGPGGVSPGKRE